jgi:hypothetical protein
MPFGMLPLYSALFVSDAVPVVLSINYGVVDTAGGGQRVVVTVNDSTDCTAISAGGVSFSSFTIDDAFHVSGVPGAHAAGVVDVVVTNGAGDSTTGTGLIEYWTPSQITSVDMYVDANKGITDAGGGAVSQWDDQSINARVFTQPTNINQPIQTASAFGTIPSIRFVPNQFVQLVAVEVQPTARSVFAVAKWTSTNNVTLSQPGTNPPLTILGDSTGNVYCVAGVSAGSLDYNQYPEGDTLRGSGLNDGVPHLIGWTELTGGADNLKSYVGTIQNGASATVTYNGTYNGYNTIGAGYLNNDGFDGDLGAVVVVSDIISGGDLTYLDTWARQRFGVPVTLPPPVVSAVNYSFVDTSGNGQRVVVTVNNSATCIGISAGGVTFTSFAIDDSTHVSGIPGAHAAGVVDVVVTNYGGDSTTGTGLIEYWDPSQITGVTRYFDSSKNVTDAGGGEVSSWIDIVGADNGTQATSINRPILTASIFGTMPSIKFTPEQWLTLSIGESALTEFSYFLVMKTISALDFSTAITPGFNPALTFLGGSGWNGFGVDGGAIAYKSYDVALETWGSGVNNGLPHIIGMTSDHFNATPTRQGYLDGAVIGSTSALGGTNLSYYDHLGDGIGNVDGFNGDVGAFISLGGTVISVGDLTKLTAWSKQRFGTP